MEEILNPYLNKHIDANNTNIVEKLKPLISEFSFFKNISDYFPNIKNISISKIITNLIFHFFIEDQFIFKKGDRINGIYILFTGEISVYNVEENELKFEDKKLIEQKYLKRKNIFYNIYDINLIPNLILNPGDAVGITSNYSEINISNKTVQSTRNSIVGYIPYNIYDRIIKDLGELNSGKIIPFLKGLNLFVNKNNFLEKLKLYITQRRYSKDSYIFQEGDNFKTFYIIKSGVINISVNIKKTTKSLIAPELLLGNINNVKLAGSKQNELKGFHKENFDYNIVTLCVGEAIGDIEYYKSSPFYLYSAKCTTPVDVFEVNLNKFLYLANACGDNLSKFHNKIKAKLDFFKKRIKNINATIKKVNKDTCRTDVYTKIFLNNNIYKYNEEDEKYINSSNKPLGQTIKKYKSIKMKNNLNSVVPYYLSIIEEKKKCFSAKTSDKKKIFFRSRPLFKNKKLLNSRNKLPGGIHFKKIKNYFLNKNEDKPRNHLLIKNSIISNNDSKNKKSSLESFELEKINKALSSLSSIDDLKKKNFVNLFYENYKKEHSSRDKALFNKKLKHNFLMQNRKDYINRTFKTSSKSIFHLTNPLKFGSFTFNHIL